MSKTLIVQVTRRSGHAQAALQRRAPKFKHRNEPRGGSQNQSRDLLADAEESRMDRASQFEEGW